MSVFIGNKEFLDCTECPRCKPTDGLKHGNLVYLEPWKEQRTCGSGWIHHHVSSCALYEKKGTQLSNDAN